MTCGDTRQRFHCASTFLKSRGTTMIVANIEDYRKQCEARLPRFLYDYISGGSFQENTPRANIAELQATLLRQRVMVDESHLKLSTQLWDQAMSLPVVLGRCARGCAKDRRFPLVPALHAQGSRLRQERDRTIGFRRLQGTGIHRRSSDPRAALQRSARRDGEGPDASRDAWVRRSRCDAPRWALDIVTKGWPLKFGTVAEAMPKGVPYGKFVHDNFDASTTWKDIEWVRSIFPGRITLKGILDPEDAKRAVLTNIDGIVVSNHGGRQLDSVTSTIRALPKVVDAAAPRHAS
jgi:L-lactate dehydrogenase (cytochrome)